MSLVGFFHFFSSRIQQHLEAFEVVAQHRFFAFLLLRRYCRECLLLLLAVVVVSNPTQQRKMRNARTDKNLHILRHFFNKAHVFLDFNAENFKKLSIFFILLYLSLFTQLIVFHVIGN